MNIQILNSLLAQEVLSMEVSENSMKELKDQLKGLLPDPKVLVSSTVEGVESIVIYGIKVWTKIPSGIIMN